MDDYSGSNQPIRLGDEVAEALNAGTPVVALESTIIAHGLPHPQNLEAAHAIEGTIRSGGAVPATVAVLEGAIRVGLCATDLERIAASDGVAKVSLRDIGWVLAAGRPGATTVAATMLVAHRAGIRVFATGGIGGVHRGEQHDVSADLTALGTIPVAVVCAGAKAILDIPRTLEHLETLGVPVIGQGTDVFPEILDPWNQPADNHPFRRRCQNRFDPGGSLVHGPHQRCRGRRTCTSRTRGRPPGDSQSHQARLARGSNR